jgi:hypothetical protein
MGTSVSPWFWAEREGLVVSAITDNAQGLSAGACVHFSAQPEPFIYCH